MTTAKTEEKTAHTPGEWRASTHPANDPKYCHVFTRSRTVALVPRVKNESMVSVGSAEANARLIAAAPCMLKALKVVLPVLEGLAKERHVMVGEARRGEHRDKLHAAIAKAEGEAV